MEPIKKIQDLYLFVDILRRQGGHPVVLSRVAQKIQVSFQAVKLWLEVLNRMYVCFSVWPYTRSLPRAIQKPPKVYFFDNADLFTDNGEGPCFENMVATHLLKKIHHAEDRTGAYFELRYIRDKESREVDFIILKEHKIFALIEVKLSDDKISPSLQYYSRKLKPRHSLQIVAFLKQEYQKHGLRVLTLPTALKVLF